MEIVNTTDINAAEAIEFLIDLGGLKRLIGTDACACFVVSRPIDTPRFYTQLIENVMSIDSTTRQHIAFIVFYGDSTIYARATSYHERYQMTEATLHDVSISSDFHRRFDETYAQLFRDSPESVDRRHFASHMTHAADALMDRFHIREALLPCIVFVDPKDPRTTRVVSLAGTNIVFTLYSRVLSPLSDAFRDLQDWLSFQKEYDDLLQLESNRNQALEFLHTADEHEAGLRREVQGAEKELSSLSGNDIPSTTKAKFEQARIEFENIDDEIKAILGEIERQGKSSARELQLIRLKKLRQKSQQRMDAFRGQAYMNQLRNQVKEATSQLNIFLRKKSESELTLSKIPYTISESLLRAKSALDRRTEESLEFGYDWEAVSSKWRRDWRHREAPPVGPRAFGVVDHVLSRVMSVNSNTVARVGDQIEFDVALSFAGEDRSVAESVADLLKHRGVRVFYDRDEEEELWGRDMYQHLAEVYSNKAHFCIMFLSAAYADKRWTSHELRNAQARAFRENREYILPVRLDDTVIPGIPETIGYLDMREVDATTVVNAIVKKLGLLDDRETA